MKIVVKKSKINRTKIGLIKLTSDSRISLEQLNSKLKQATGCKGLLNGPIAFPVKVFNVPVRRAPGGNGSGTYDHFERRQYKRLYEIRDFSVIDTLFEALSAYKNISYSISFDN
jgi:ribosomal protein S10